jgi:putative endonuclease
MRSTWTYILASKPRGTLYIGVTNGLIQRINQHRTGKGSAFTRRYHVHTLVWYEEFARARDAIQREKSLKGYNRAWKINLIERTNPHWQDLFPTLPGVAPVPVLVPRGTLDPRPKAEDGGWVGGNLHHKCHARACPECPSRPILRPRRDKRHSKYSEGRGVEGFSPAERWPIGPKAPASRPFLAPVTWMAGPSEQVPRMTAECVGRGVRLDTRYRQLTRIRRRVIYLVRQGDCYGCWLLAPGTARIPRFLGKQGVDEEIDRRLPKSGGQ